MNLSAVYQNRDRNEIIHIAFFALAAMKRGDLAVADMWMRRLG